MNKTASIPGRKIKLDGLSLTCETCGEISHNIDNIVIPLYPDKVNPERQLFYLISIDTRYVCQCLLDQFRQTKEITGLPPIIAIWFDKVSLN